MTNTTRIGGSGVYERNPVGYTDRVRRHIHIGHAIREARKERGWNQEQLGEAARKMLLPGHDAGELERINKFTVSKAERDPYVRKYATLVRLAGALGRTIGDLEDFVQMKPLGAVTGTEVKQRRPRAAAG